MVTKGYTSLHIKKTTVPLLNQARAEEAGRTGKSNIEQDEFLRFLLILYKSVKGDTPVLTSVWKKMDRKEE